MIRSQKFRMEICGEVGRLNGEVGAHMIHSEKFRMGTCGEFGRLNGEVRACMHWGE